MSYRFGKSQSFTLAQLRAGEPLRQHQVMQEIHAYLGDPHDSFDAAARALAEALNQVVPF